MGFVARHAQIPEVAWKPAASFMCGAVQISCSSLFEKEDFSTSNPKSLCFYSRPSVGPPRKEPKELMGTQYEPHHKTKVMEKTHC